MEIVTPQLLWKDYSDDEAFEASVVGRHVGDVSLIEEVYFNGPRTDDGVTRIFAVMHLPAVAAPRLPAILLFDDEKKTSHSIPYVEALVSRGFAVLDVDYAGKKDSGRYTLYPDSLACGNNGLDKALPSELKRSSAYVRTSVGLRAAAYLKARGEIDPERIGLFGVGEGGGIVWRLAMLERFKAGMTIFGGGIVDDELKSDPLFLTYKAALDARSYAPFARCPMLIQTTSNERNNSLDYMAELYDGSKSAWLSVGERANRGIIVRQKKNYLYWFLYQLYGEGYMPASPRLSARESGGGLYYDIEADPAHEIVAIQLFVSQGRLNAAYRNWSACRVDKAGEGKYLAKVDVYVDSEPVYAFVSIKYRHSLYVTSQLVMRIPKLMNIAVRPKRSRLIYESAMGKDDFSVPDDYDLSYNDEKLAMEKGPFGIEGVCSATHRLVTFKLGDYQFRGERDSVLRLLVYVDMPAEVEFSIMDRDGKVYKCVRSYGPSDEWVTVTLAASDFRREGQTLADFGEAVAVNVGADCRLLINSLLWV